MINLARQAFVNPLVSTVGASFQPGAVGAVGRCPGCGNLVAVGNAIQPQIGGGFNPANVGTTFGQQGLGGSVPYGLPQLGGGFNPANVGTTFGQQGLGGSVPYGLPQATGFGQINPLASQFTPGVNPLAAQFGTNLPISTHLSHQGVGGRAGYGVDPRQAFGMAGQQGGYADPNVVSGLINSTIGDPISSLLSQQQQQQWNPLAQQQLPIRPLIGGQQAVGGQSFIPGLASPITQWNDPYRAFIEAQLISQLANNPLYQLQRAYGGVAETTGQGMPFGAGQQFNPFFGNVPFYG